MGEKLREALESVTSREDCVIEEYCNCVNCGGPDGLCADLPEEYYERDVDDVIVEFEGQALREEIRIDKQIKAKKEKARKREESNRKRRETYLRNYKENQKIKEHRKWIKEAESLLQKRKSMSQAFNIANNMINGKPIKKDNNIEDHYERKIRKEIMFREKEIKRLQKIKKDRAKASKKGSRLK